ncbi:MAG: hypothetical protein WCA57_19505, partial [Ilumatobacteraceae bacterium]
MSGVVVAISLGSVSGAVVAASSSPPVQATIANTSAVRRTSGLCLMSDSLLLHLGRYEDLDV